MTMSIEERRIIYFWGCSNYEFTVRRIAMLAALTVDPELKHHLAVLQDKLFTKTTEKEYITLFKANRIWMKSYFAAEKQIMEVIKNMEKVSGETTIG